MKRPTKKRKKYFSETYQYFDTYVNYTPKDIREIADNMEEDGILSFQFHINYEDIYTSICAEETPEEAEKRYKRELAEYKKFKTKQAEMNARERDMIIKKAKELKITAEDLT